MEMDKLLSSLEQSNGCSKNGKMKELNPNMSAFDDLDKEHNVCKVNGEVTEFASVPLATVTGEVDENPEYIVGTESDGPETSSNYISKTKSMKSNLPARKLSVDSCQSDEGKISILDPADFQNQEGQYSRIRKINTATESDSSGTFVYSDSGRPNSVRLSLKTRNRYRSDTHRVDQGEVTAHAHSATMNDCVEVLVHGLVDSKRMIKEKEREIADLRIVNEEHRKKQSWEIAYRQGSQEWRRKCSVLQEEVALQKRKIEIQDKENENMQAVIEQKNNEMQGLQMKLEEEKFKNGDLLATIEQKDKKIQGLQLELDKEKIKNGVLVEQKDNEIRGLKLKLDKEKIKNGVLVEQKDNEIRGLNLKLEEEKLKNGDLQAANGQKDIEMKGLTLKLEEEKLKSGDLQAANEQKDNEIQGLKLEVEQLSAALESSKRKNSNLRKINNELSTTLDELGDQVVRKEAELLRCSNDYQHIVNELITSLVTFQQRDQTNQVLRNEFSNMDITALMGEINVHVPD